MDLYAIARRQHGVFSRSQALECGMSSARIRAELSAGRWVERGWRVYVIAGSPGTTLTPVWVAYLSCPGQPVVSHASAAVLHGFEVVAAQVWLTVAPSSDVRRQGVRIVRAALVAGDVVDLAGLRLTSLARTVLDCLGVLPFRSALDLLDRAVQQRVLDLDEVAEHARSMLGKAGTPQLRRLLRHAARDAHSEAERRLHALLRKAGITGWVANAQVRDRAGRRLGIADVLFASARLVIEVDGRRWHGADRFQRDRTRQNAFAQAGYRVVRFTWDDIVERPTYVISTVKRMLATNASS